MAARTSEERLRWLLAYSPSKDHIWQTGKHWMVFNEYVDGSRTIKIAYGRTYEECIDAALNGEAKDYE